MSVKKDYVLNWILVLPVSIVAYVLVFFVVGLFDIFHSEGDKLYFLLPIVSSAIAGIVFVKVGHLIAPNFRKQVAFILLIILLVVSIFLGYYSIEGKEYSKLLANVAQVITGTLTFFSLESDNK